MSGKLRRLLTLSWACLVPGCSAVDAVNALVPSSGYKIVKDQAYAPGPRHQLDIYVPDIAKPAAPTAPVIVFIYGGNWQFGDKADYLFVGEAMSTRGFVTMIPDYRLYPQTRYPGFLEDSAAAVRWARDHAKEYGGDPHRLFVMGHSAGGYNAMMLAVDGRWLGQVGMNPNRDLMGAIGLAGPYDFLPLQDETLKIIFGPKQTRPDTQPINHVGSPPPPPLFLATGTTDKIVDPGNVDRMTAKVRAAGGTVETKFYKGIGHEVLIGTLASPLRFLAPLRQDIDAFIRAKLAAESPATPKFAGG